MILQGGVLTSNKLEVSSKKSALVSLQQRGTAFSVSNVTGTIAAALAANSSLFAMRLDAGAGNKDAFIERVRISFTTLVAFTVPLTAGRRLAVYRGSNAGVAMSGGTAITTVAKKHSLSPDSEFELAQGGDIRIATTGALTVGGAIFETNEFATMSLVHVGNAGNFMESVFEFNASEGSPIVLEPGQILAIRNPVAMDAAGTFQVSVRVDWYEEDTNTL
jgi:hypothetical protein